MEISRSSSQAQSLPEQSPIRIYSRPSLRPSLASPKDLSPLQINEMFLLMRSYYENIDQNDFYRDLSEKNKLILLTNQAGQVVGFSTLLKVEIPTSQGPVKAVFSGDTVVERQYWGQKQLGLYFLYFLFLEKLKNPFVPLYWFLMSKGYKTYLLMANNFSVHYPRYERPTPIYFQNLMDRFYGSKFPGKYKFLTGTIQSSESSCHLREGIAPITNELRIKSPRIAFFENANPDWKLGTELCCVAEMKLSMPLKYFFKKAVWQKLKDWSSR